MNAKNIQAINQQIYRQFPEVSGTRPKVTQQKAGGAANYLLTFNGRGEGPGGQSFKRTVRVMADENGRILKVTTSR
jgi:hypothetical protein